MKRTEIGLRIEYARKYRGLTLKQLSELCHSIDESITYNGMWQWETGRRTPKYETTKVISQALLVHAQYFLDADHYGDPIELIQPYLLGEDERLGEKLGTDIIPAKAFKNKEGKLGYVKPRLEDLTSAELDKVITLVNKMLKKK